MLIDSIYFLESSTNTLHLPCRMVTPTLFYVDAITGFQPTMETFNLILKHQTKPKFTFDHPSFSHYIKDHHGKTEEVSEYEHIVFLTLCYPISFFVLASSKLPRILYLLQLIFMRKEMFILIN